MSDHVKFVVGGTVQADEGNYLSRSADDDLLKACVDRKFAYVLTARQIGKSSLMIATSQQLQKKGYQTPMIATAQQKGYQTPMISLAGIGSNLDSDKWYGTLVSELGDELGIETEVQTWWLEHSNLSNPYRFQRLLRDVVLTEIRAPIVIFLDEIDTMLRFEFGDDFFAAIRSIYNDRAKYSEYHRLTFVLLGVATPDDLIKDKKRTPFNIGERIDVNDFTKDELKLFEQALIDNHGPIGGEYFATIYEWANGHPYLTQKLCREVFQMTGPLKDNLVEQLVKKIFLSEEITDENLTFVQSRVLADRHVYDMLQIYNDVLTGTPVLDNTQSMPITRLKLYGLLVSHNNQLHIRNRIYKQFFDESWIQDKLVDPNYSSSQVIIRRSLDEAEKVEKTKPSQALEYYQTAQKMINKYPELDIELEISPDKLDKKIKNLNEAITVYAEIERLIKEEKNSEALDRLIDTFLVPKNYQYRDVVKLFWQLTYPMVYKEDSLEDKALQAINRLLNSWSFSTVKLEKQYTRLQTDITNLNSQFSEFDEINAICQRLQKRIEKDLNILNDSKTQVEGWQTGLNNDNDKDNIISAIGVSDKVDHGIFQLHKGQIFDISRDTGQIYRKELVRLQQNYMSPKKLRVGFFLFVFFITISSLLPVLELLIFLYWNKKGGKFIPYRYRLR
ncbi:AAA-like domain-containing protein [Anaerolineales bacterium HSG24]|nr:AAA-like domain-containing protein [Anaerolineales bacterium HSG24]